MHQSQRKARVARGLYRPSFRPWGCVHLSATLGLDPNKQNEYSIGLFQVNYAVHKPMLDEMGISEADLRDPLINAKVALKIYQMQGWQAWGAYTNGSYLRY